MPPGVNSCRASRHPVPPLQTLAFNTEWRFSLRRFLAWTLFCHSTGSGGGSVAHCVAKLMFQYGYRSRDKQHNKRLLDNFRAALDTPERRRQLVQSAHQRLRWERLDDLVKSRAVLLNGGIDQPGWIAVVDLATDDWTAALTDATAAMDGLAAFLGRDLLAWRPTTC